MNKTIFPAMMAAIILGGLVKPAHTQPAHTGYPTKPVKIIVPFTPGGAVDSVARITAERLTQETGQTFIVENKPGAGGAIGVAAVARAPADGYTLLLGSIGPMTINPSLYSKLPYSVEQDFVPIIELANTPLVIATQPIAGASSVKELIAQLKANPEKMTYGSAGVGNITHLAAAYFLNKAGVKASHIPYQGSAPAISDFLGGRLDFMFDVMPTAVPYVSANKYQALAVTTKNRSNAIPDVPTLNELGLGPFDVSSWFGVFAPVGTSGEIISKLNSLMNKAIHEDSVRSRLDNMGYNAVGGSQTNFASFVHSETARWREVVNDVGAKQE